MNHVILVTSVSGDHLRMSILLTQQLSIKKWIINIALPGNKDNGAVYLWYRIIQKHWKSTSCSLFEEWLEVMSNIASYERMIFRVSGRIDVYKKIWGSFLALIEKNV